MDNLTLSDYINLIIERKGGNPINYHNLMDAIAYHETGPRSRMNPSTVQKGGGPGRGLFQFEIGDNEGGNIAVNRTYNFHKSNNIPVPEWLHSIWENKKSVDFSLLPADQQKILFLGNYMQHPKANLGDVMSGKESYKDFWLNYHWAGDSKQREGKIEAWKESMTERNLDVAQTLPPWMSNTVPENTFNMNFNDLMQNIFGNTGSSIVDNNK